jgi:CubicO group peptidase (beta-lactamase class C family)
VVSGEDAAAVSHVPPAPLDRRTFLRAATASAALLPAASAASGDAAATVRPPTQGAVATRSGEPMRKVGGVAEPWNERMRRIMRAHVERGELPGVVAAVSRRGEVSIETVGAQAFGGAAMRPDTLFRIASLTKPVTAAAAMILVEECTLRLDDPVDRWLPELAGRRVLRTLDSPVDDTVPAARAITVRDLLTLRLGIGAVMAAPGTYPIQQRMAEAGVAPGPDIPAYPADELMRRFGTLPLLHQPGEKWLYHSGSDILGVLVSRASGRSLGTFLRERIFAPLGMGDTGFSVPPDDVGRLATCYRADRQTGGLAVYDEARGGRFARPPVFESGGSGLVSTASDYLAFCRMMLGRGTLHGSRILSRASVELMTMDHLTPAQKVDAAIFLGGNRGWGFGMAVYTRRDELWAVPGRFGWDGGYGTSAYSEPQEGLIGVLMTQRMMDSPAPPRVFTDFWTVAYQSEADG